jgi:hypothetical protein
MGRSKVMNYEVYYMGQLSEEWHLIGTAEKEVWAMEFALLWARTGKVQVKYHDRERQKRTLIFSTTGEVIK